MALKQKTVSGVAWSGAGNLARQAMSVFTLIVLARFLTPEDFGVFAILMVVVAFIDIFAAMGTSQAVIHLETPGQRMLSSIFYFNIVAGLALFGALYLLSEPLATFFENSKLAHLLQLMGLIFVASTPGLVQRALLEKAMMFKVLAAMETLALALGSLAGMLAAVWGMGVYSLLIMALLNTTLLLIGLWAKSTWRPSRPDSMTHIKSDISRILGYSLNLTGFAAINYLTRQSDQFLIGKFMGSGALGVYSMAYRIMLYPLENIARVIVRVLFPAFSEIGRGDDASFKQAYINATSYIALLSFPLMAGLCAVSHNLVDTVFGERWSQMAVILMILAPVGLMQSIVATASHICMVKGTTDALFKIGMLNAVVMVVLFVCGLPFGVEGVAAACAIANLILLYPNLKVAWQQINLGVFEGMMALAPFLYVSILMATTVYLIGRVLTSHDTAQWAVLLIQVLAGVFIYASLLTLLYRQRVVGMIRRLRH